MSKVLRQISEHDLPRWQKLLLILLELSSEGTKQIRYEDIVVSAFNRFKETFHLRGYKNYPDSGDLVHKPLYDMRRKGLLVANQKTFSFTNKGLQIAQRLEKLVSRKKSKTLIFKPSREIGKDIERILSSSAFDFFTNGKLEKILDTDFFQYLGVSVHTSKNEFLNRMETIDYSIEESRNYYPKNIYNFLVKYHNFMNKKFQEIISTVSK